MLLSKYPLYPRQSVPVSVSASQAGSSSSAPLSPSLTIASSSTTLAPSSPSSDSRTLTSLTSTSTSNAISSSTSVFSSTSNGVTPSSTATSSSAIPTFHASSSSPTSTTTDARSSSSSPPDPPSLTPSSGLSLTTFTTSFVTDIGGSPTTIFTPIITALRTPAPSRASARTNLIAGSAVGGLVLFIIGLTTLFILRRRVQRQRYWALTREQLPSRATFLAGEDMDLPHPSPPFMHSNQDPFASRSSRNVSGTSSYRYSQSSREQSPSLSTSPPRLFRPRASESGSIFQEGVYPPPSATLMDPLTSPSQSVDLTRIIDDVMGPSHEGARDVSEVDSLLIGHEHGQVQQQGQGHMREHQLEGSAVMASPLTFTLANPDSRLDLPESPPSSPPPPPPSRWLSRSPNTSPRNSPLHKAHPI